jgi:hypothetical protein
MNMPSHLSNLTIHPECTFSESLGDHSEISAITTDRENSVHGYLWKVCPQFGFSPRNHPPALALIDGLSLGTGQQSLMDAQIPTHFVGPLWCSERIMATATLNSIFFDAMNFQRDAIKVHLGVPMLAHETLLGMVPHHDIVRIACQWLTCDRITL